jgi:asparagine synthase (glutamine-hydrolysing)
MCGIFAILNNTILPDPFIYSQFEKGKNRGPEFSTLENITVKAKIGFHRLAINGIDEISNQPIIIDDIALICNGEIYNYKELYKSLKIEPETNSDCEVIIHLYKQFGIEYTLQILDGVFAFILIDYRLSNQKSKIYVARDPFGVRPLYFLKPKNITNNYQHVFSFASEIKVLNEIKIKLNNYYSNNKEYIIEHFEPATYSIFELPNSVLSSWVLNETNTNKKYHTIGNTPTTYNIKYHNNSKNNFIDTSHTRNKINIISNIQEYLINAVEKRCITTERPIACLLSGGLDSSLIAALVSQYHMKNSLPKIETYSIGLADSEDLKHAEIVAEYLGTKHTSIILTEKDFLEAIPEVIYATESNDTTTVRASIGNWLLGKYISENSDAKVIFNGDGSDELLGGYIYMKHAPNHLEFDKECRRLMTDIHKFDVLRSDKSISSHGLEPRTPFLDRAFVQYYMSIPSEIRFSNFNENNFGSYYNQNMEKSLLRNAFSSEYYVNYDGKPLLPSSILWRRKEAFSDGVSKHSRSLYQIIQEYTDTLYPEFDSTVFGKHLIPKTSEQYYYRKLFEEYYKGTANIIPYFWMPKYIDAKDASARSLFIYNA